MNRFLNTGSICCRVICTMKALSLRFLATLALLICLLPRSARAAETNHYNVLFIISDDMRTELGCYGSKIAKTPNLDKLAVAGVMFERAYCQLALCDPSRTSMLTGRRPRTTGVLGNRGFFRDAHPDYVTLPQLFKNNGYVSLRAGKIFHGGFDDPESWTEGGDPHRLGSMTNQNGQTPNNELLLSQYRRSRTNRASSTPRLSRAQYSDRWLELEGNGESHGDYRTTDQAIKFLRENKDRQFFLGFGLVKPHSPPTAPKRFYDLYDVDKIPLPPNFAPRPTVPEGFPAAAIRSKNSDLFIRRDATPAEAREMIRAYLASCSWVDWNIGRVIAELDRLGLREKTIIVFWSDHGYQLGENGRWSKAGSLFEPVARQPLIIVAPNAEGNGRVCKRIVESLDIYPTLAELCGLPLPEGLEGHSLVPLLNNPQADWNYPAYTIWTEDGKSVQGVTVRTERWRYAEYGGGKNGAMLLDEAADPNELTNLANDPQFAPVRARLSALVKQYIAGMPTQ